jgi:hypothetical protein
VIKISEVASEAILEAFKKFIEICDSKMSENDHA